MRNMVKGSKGFTLLEILASIALLVIVSLIIFNVISTSVQGIITAQQIRIATFHIQNVMERIQSTTFTNMVSAFPDGAVVDEDVVGGYLLNSESVVVSYPQGTGNDPLEIEVELTWTDNKGEGRSIIFRTIRTSMI